MRCTRCPAPAFLRVDDSTVLCADCWNAVTERLKADFNSTLGPATGVDTAAAPDLSDPSVAAAVNNSLTSVPNPPEASPASDMAPGLIKSGAGSSFDDGIPDALIWVRVA